MDSPFMGQIQSFGFQFAPRGWQLCAGQLMSISQNSALFALLGTVYGGNGTSTFQLPDLQGRVAIGQGNGPGLSSYVLGEKAGTENVSILTSNMPAHTHVATFTPTGGGSGGGGTAITATLNVCNTVGNLATGGGGLFAGSHGLGSSTGIYAAAGTATVPMAPGAITVSGGGGGGGITGGTVTNALTGSNIPISVLSPYLCINYSIALVGIFPTRN